MPPSALADGGFEGAVQSRLLFGHPGRDTLLTYLDNLPDATRKHTFVILISLAQLSASERRGPVFEHVLHRVANMCDGKNVRMYVLSDELLAAVPDPRQHSELHVTNIAMDLKVAILRLVQKYAPQSYAGMNQSKVATVYNLGRQRTQLKQLIGRHIAESGPKSPPAAAPRPAPAPALAPAPAPTPAPVARPAPGGLITDQHLNRIQAFMEMSGPAAFGRRFLKTQRMCLIGEVGDPRPVMAEVHVDVPAFCRAFLDGRDLRDITPVFGTLTSILDQLVLKSLPHMRFPVSGLSINLNIETVFSDGFVDFFDHLPGGIKDVDIEFRIADIIQDLAGFKNARDRILAAGGSVAVDGVTPDMIGLIDFTRLNAKMVKVVWDAASAVLLGNATAELQRIQRAGAVLCLCRVDAPQARAVGNRAGIALFQGYHIDALLDRADREG